MRHCRRFVMVADSHGDCLDPVAEKALFSFISDFKPTVRLHLGDLWDFRNLRNGAGEKELAESMEPDWDAGKEFFLRYFPKGTENHLLLGNHDARMWEAASDIDGVKRDYAQGKLKEIKALAAKRRVKTYPYDSRLGVLNIGHLRAIHGYASGRNAGTVHARTYGNSFFGHVHEVSTNPVENLTGPAEARCIGCLTRTDMAYNSRGLAKLRHRNGFLAGLLFSDGTYHSQQISRVGDSFYAPTDFKAY